MPRTKQFQEEEVLQKAVEIFWRKGYHATSMEDLVQYLGINRGSLYDTFGGKKQLFEKAIRKYIQDNTKITHELLSQHKSVKEGLYHFFKVVVEGSIADDEKKGCLVVNTSTELATSDPEMAKILIRNRQNFEEIFLQYLKTGQEKGEIGNDKDLEAISKYLVTFFNGLKVSAKINPQGADMHAVVRAGLSVLDR